MKHKEKLRSTLLGFNNTVNRFPITILLFLFSAILTSYSISNHTDDFTEILFALAVGAVVFLVLQIVNERFFHGRKIRLLFCAVSIIVTVLYYLILEFAVESITIETLTRTIVIIFILLIGFIWVPSIKSRIGFSESFMVSFKAFFIVAFYSIILFVGIALVLVTIDNLLFDIDGLAYSHVGNIIAYIYAPIYFLSLIPIFPVYSKRDKDSKEETEKDLRKAIEPSRFLDGLISYIIIPITAVFTIILLLYIVLNITGDFWKDNLMEPLLVTYSITVITVYLLACVISSKSAQYFRRIFPKVLIPVVLFQTISSILKIGELGITSGRYYVIMFGIFATISAIIFSIRPNKKNNVIAPLIIILSLISILPPVDAFTISKRNQVKRLENVLKENSMLRDGKIVANPNLSQEEKEIIISSVQYLNRMDYIDDITWLKGYSDSYDFERTFGFSQYGSTIKEPKIYHFYLTGQSPIDISAYDFFLQATLFGKDQNTPFESTPWDQGYTLTQEYNNGMGDLILKDGQGKELIRYSLNSIFDTYKNKEEQYSEILLNEAEFRVENEKAILNIVVQDFLLETWDDSTFQKIEAYIMVKIK